MRGDVTSGKWIADQGEWWGARGKLGSLSFQLTKAQDAGESSQGSFQGGLHAPPHCSLLRAVLLTNQRPFPA